MSHLQPSYLFSKLLSGIQSGHTLHLDLLDDGTLAIPWLSERTYHISMVTKEIFVCPILQCNMYLVTIKELDIKGIVLLEWSKIDTQDF